ncbi:hypothetical protein [Microbacterium kyungheense]|uniref:Uncharacterized protein n=1 Tax=Microbacterium kyungheense TaxID=1263636 RepID=A0A543FM19_9MICO|nr:hypothetical protein [Microbacterium kyungheense]TQM34900.1 hypothetical protein FB391_1195 [Microbacterium kyungheense]
MTSPYSRIPALEVRERAVCMCDHGDACSSFAPGHALHLIQARLAAATPSDWADAIVADADARSGFVIVRTLAGDEIALWNGTGAAEAAAPGTPVALHERYHVLAVGARRFNVLRG